MIAIPRGFVAWFVASLIWSAMQPPPSSAQGQGDYCNFESPQVKPVALAIVGDSSDPAVGDAYVLVCNTPNNRVEVYDLTNPSVPVLEVTIPVGLEPVSVAFRRFSTAGGPRNMMYTANWLGDSVSIVELFSTGGVLDYRMITNAAVSTQRLASTDPVQGTNRSSLRRWSSATETSSWWPSAREARLRS